MSKISIPKRIAQVWVKITTDQIPSRWDGGRSSIPRFLPHWDHHIYRDEEIEALIEAIDPDFLFIYRSFPYAIQRADAARAFILYQYGGVYMDMDYEIISQNFESLFYGNPYDDHLYLVPSGNVPSYYTNSFMASTARHPFWLEYIDRMKNDNPWYIMGKHLVVQNQTGPLALTDCARKTQSIVKVLPSKKITPCSVCNTSCEIDSAYLKQLEGSSWIGYDTRVYIVLMCNHRTILTTIVVLASLIVIFFLLWLIYYFLVR